jgi:hypothetical protein
MLTDEKDGMGLPHEEARECILRVPAVLMYDNDDVIRRVALLKSLGYEEAGAMVLKQPSILNFKEETVKETAAWWNQTGLDHVKLVTAHPNLLGVCSVEELQAKLDFLSRVAKLSVADLNSGGSLFAANLDTLRSRFFYALKHGALERYKLSTLIFCSDARFLRFVHQLDDLPTPERLQNTSKRWHRRHSRSGWRRRRRGAFVTRCEFDSVTDT